MRIFGRLVKATLMEIIFLYLILNLLCLIEINMFVYDAVFSYLYFRLLQIILLCGEISNKYLKNNINVIVSYFLVATVLPWEAEI